MTSNELDEKINDLIENDDTENFYSLISEIIEENREYASDLDQNLNEAFNIISDNINESNHDKKVSFLCLFFEILISENIDFSNYLQKTFQIIKSNGVYSDENIKRIINICSNATIKKKDLFNNLTQFSKDKIEYLYIIFSLVGFKEIIVDNLSDNWELIIDLLDNPEIKSNSNSIKNLLKCLELLINLSEGKFRPYASSALYQALDYLTETDIELQKRSLMIIYSLTKYCDEQLKPLSDNIIDFLKVLQNGNNIEINNLCNTMLKHFTGKKDEEENMNNEDSNGNENENENNMNESENDNYNNENGNKNNTEKENIEEISDKNNQNEKHDDNNENNYYNINEDNENENDNDNGNDYDHEKNLQNNYVPEEKQEKEEGPPEQKDYKNEQNEYRNENEENESRNIYRNDYKNEDDNEDNVEDNKIENTNEQENEDESRYNYKNIIRKEDGQSNIVNNTTSSNQRSNKRDLEESEKDYNYKEINRNNNFNNINNKNFNNNEDNLNNIDINAIIKKIKDLSDKQIIILDSIEQYKRDTKRIINQKKVKIQALEAKIEELKEKIRIEKNKKRNRPGQTNYQMRRKKNNNNRNDYNDEYDPYNNDDYRY